MTTPELEAYVSRSRVSGMTDEQIKQNLMSQGWTEDDVSQALSAGTTRAAAAPVVSSGNGRRTSVLVIAGIILLAAMVTGAYFLFGNKSSSSLESEDNNQNQQANSSQTYNGKDYSSYKCDMVFSEQDYTRIYGVAPQKLNGQWVRDNNNGASLECSYFLNKINKVVIDFGDGEEWGYNIQKDVMSGFSDGKIISIPNLGVKAIYSTDMVQKDLSNEVLVLTADDHVISVSSTRTKRDGQAVMDKELANTIEVARIVVNNLDRLEK